MALTALLPSTLPRSSGFCRIGIFDWSSHGASRPYPTKSVWASHYPARVCQDRSKSAHISCPKVSRRVWLCDCSSYDAPSFHPKCREVFSYIARPSVFRRILICDCSSYGAPSFHPTTSVTAWHYSVRVVILLSSFGVNINPNLPPTKLSRRVNRMNCLQIYGSDRDALKSPWSGR